MPSHGGNPAKPGDFTPLFDLPPARHTEQDMIALGRLMDAAPDNPKDGPDDEENPYVPAGYTYLGQFVDHDLTFDTTSSFSDLNTFEHVSDTRTPRFDLDNVYGRGPDDQPYMYEAPKNDPSYKSLLVLGKNLNNGLKDVQRTAAGTAIIGDPRNDENSIVVQIQATMIRFHNAMVDRALSGIGTHKRTGKDAFTWAQTQTRWHYQKMLLDDYLPRIIDTGAPTVSGLFRDIQRRVRPTPRWFPLDRGAFMPLEFAVAAYRFGHSMIRPGYRLRNTPADIASGLFPIFSGQHGGLRGFQDLDPKRGIEWNLFFMPQLPAGTPLDAPGQVDNNAKNNGQGDNLRVQFAYKIDTMLVDPITKLPMDVAPGTLPDFPNPANLRSLAIRNLVRGKDFNLPSGEAVADFLGVPRLSPDHIAVRRQQGAIGSTNFDTRNRIPVHTQLPALLGNTPLWFYILAEAEQTVIAGMNAPGAGPQTPFGLGTRLGPVGAAIVAETFIGLMLLDPDSLLNNLDAFSPINGTPNFSMPEILKEGGVAI